jgi:hypothetical protein
MIIGYYALLSSPYKLRVFSWVILKVETKKFSRYGDGEEIVYQALQVNFWSPVDDESRGNLFSSVVEVVDHDAVLGFEFGCQDQKKFQKKRSKFDQKF